MEKLKDLGQRYVLIAEDDQAERQLIFEAYKESDLEKNIEFVHSGKDLIESLKEIRETGKPLPSIIMIDLNMPGISGIETIQEIKTDEELKMIPIIVLSNSNHDKDIIRSYKSGANAYIQKPQTYKDLLDLIDEIYGFWLKRVLYPETRY